MRRDEELKQRIQESEVLRQRIHTALLTLKETGFLEVLRERAKVMNITEGTDLLVRAALAGAESRGYSAATDDVEYALTTWAKPVVDSVRTAERATKERELELAVHSGDMSQAEMDRELKRLYGDTK